MEFKGWWIKVCPRKTEATIRVLAGPDDQNKTDDHTWQQGDPEEFPLFGGIDYKKVHVQGYSGQNGKSVYFAVCHDNQICCKHFEFDRGENHDIDRDDTDEWKCS